jgi:branched-chain amino acid transport system permease protein
MAPSTAELGTRDRVARAVSRAAAGPNSFLLIVVIAAAIVLLLGNSTYESELATVLVFCIAAVGQQWVLGELGQASIGAAAFLTLGAFVGARTAQTSWGHFPIPLILAALAGALAGAVIGLSALRFRGLYLLLSTLALNYVVIFIAEWYEGNAGGLQVPPPAIGSLQLGTPTNFAIVELVILSVIVIGMNGMYRRAPGRIWSAIRQNEVVASATGINVTRWKTVAFIGSSAVTAVAGCLFAYQVAFVSYQSFSLDIAISVLVMVFVGGRRSLAGAVLGACFVELLPFLLQEAFGSGSYGGGAGISSWVSERIPYLNSLVFDLLLLVLLVKERDGLIGLLTRLNRLLRGLLARHPRTGRSTT